MVNIPPNVKLFRTWLEGASYGISFSAIFHCLFQDVLGLKGYVDYVSAHWTVLSPWWWALAAVFSIAMAVVTGLVLRRRSREVNVLLTAGRLVLLEQQAQTMAAALRKETKSQSSKAN